MLNLSGSEKGKHRDPLGFAKLCTRDRPAHLLSEDIGAQVLLPIGSALGVCCRSDSLCVPWLLGLVSSCH